MDAMGAVAQPSDPRTLVRVDLGCGPRKAQGFIGVDCVALPEVDIVADLTGVFPMADNSVDVLRAHDAIEHLVDRLHTMNEIWRVCRHGAVVDIRVPSTDGRGAFQDPTHVSYWNANSFFYYCSEFPDYFQLGQQYGFKGCFKLDHLEDTEGPLRVIHTNVRLIAIKEADETKATDALASDDIYEVRRALAELLMAADRETLAAFDATAAGAAYRRVLLSGIQDLSLSAEDEWLLGRMVDALAAGKAGERGAAFQMAALLFKRPHHLPHAFHLESIPAELVLDVVRYLLQPPGLFTELGEHGRWRDWMHYLLTGIHGNILGPDLNPVWQIAGMGVFLAFNGVPLYFAGGNAQPVFALRGAIIKAAMERCGRPLDTAFPSPRTEGPIRVGIVIDNVGPRAESFAVLPLIEQFPRERVTLTVYTVRATGHRLEAYITDCADGLVTLPSDNVEAVARVRQDELDFVFYAGNCSSVTDSIAFLSFHRLGRLQATSVASVATTGLPYMDFYISGALVEPERGAQDHYTEKLILLPGSAHCFTYGTEQATDRVFATRSTLDIPEQAVVFASAASMFKLTPELCAVWARLLSRCPNALLMMFPFGPNWSSNYPAGAFRRWFFDIMAEHGVSSERIRIIDQQGLNRDDIREFLSVADIFLDTFPFSGSTSIIEPLELGMPVITWQRPFFQGAMAASLLRELGVTETIAGSSDDYLAKAAALYADRAALQRVRARIQTQMAAKPRFLDPPAFARVFYDAVLNLVDSPLPDALEHGP
jgi:hypothetical protein